MENNRITAETANEISKNFHSVPIDLSRFYERIMRAAKNGKNIIFIPIEGGEFSHITEIISRLNHEDGYTARYQKISENCGELIINW